MLGHDGDHILKLVLQNFPEVVGPGHGFTTKTESCGSKFQFIHVRSSPSKFTLFNHRARSLNNLFLLLYLFYLMEY